MANEIDRFKIRISMQMSAHRKGSHSFDGESILNFTVDENVPRNRNPDEYLAERVKEEMLRHYNQNNLHSLTYISK